MYLYKSMWVRAPMHARVLTHAIHPCMHIAHACTSTHTCTCREQDVRCPLLLSTLFPQSLSVSWKLTIAIRLASQQILGICLPHSIVRVTDTCGHAQLFVSAGNSNFSLYVCRANISHSTSSPAPCSFFSFIIFLKIFMCMCLFLSVCLCNICVHA